jgi:hypothetical protein
MGMDTTSRITSLHSGGLFRPLACSPTRESSLPGWKQLRASSTRNHADRRGALHPWLLALEWRAPAVAAPFWPALDQARAVLDSSPEELEALQSAALALHFIHAAGCAREFEHFLAHFDEHLPLLCSFSTRDEAEAWLKNHPSPPDGATVQVGEEQLTVGYWPRSGRRVLLRVPKNDALDDMVGDDEDSAP